MTKNTFTWLLIIIIIMVVLISPISIFYFKAATTTETSIPKWRLQTGTKMEANNCAIANVTTIDNTLNNTNTTVDEMRAFYGRPGGLNTYSTIKLLKALDLNVEFVIAPPNSSALSSFITNNDFVLMMVNMNALHGNPVVVETLNHSVILKGLKKHRSGDNTLYNITVIDPNFPVPLCRKLDDFTEATTMGLGLPMTGFILVNK